MPPLSRDDVVKWLEKIGKSFNDQDLTGCDLSGLEFNCRDFKRANLARARLAGAVFTSCEFKQSDLTGADLTGATFSSCLFPGARLDGATVKDTTFEYSEFKGATWTGAVVKRCTFESCEDVTGLAPHKVYRSLSDLPDEAQKLAVCRERFAPLQALVGGAIEGSEEDSECTLAGQFGGRSFRVKVDLWDGSPTLLLDTHNPADTWLYLYRDPKRQAKAKARGLSEAQEGPWLHFLSESVYLEEDTKEELDEGLTALARLTPDTRQALIEAIETYKLDTVEVGEDHIEGDFKKDILVLDLTQSVPRLLDLFSRLADTVESAGTKTVSEAETGPAPVTGPGPEEVPVTTPVEVPVTPTESPSFDLTKRCRHCGATIPWGEFECPSCHKYF